MMLDKLRDHIAEALFILQNSMEDADDFRSDDVTYSAEVQRLAVSELRKAIEMIDKEEQTT